MKLKNIFSSFYSKPIPKFSNFLNINSFNFCKKAEAKPAPAGKPAGGKPAAGGAKAGAPKEFTPDELTYKNIMESFRDYKYAFGSVNRVGETKSGNKIEFIAKKLRRAYINHGVFPQHKHLIPVKRLRTSADKLMSLKKNCEVAGVIFGREEIPDFDFVIEDKYIKNIIRYVQ